MKYLFLLCIPFILTGCFGLFSNDTTTNSTSTLIKQEKEGFSLSVPNTWKTIPLEDVPVPKTGEVVYAVASTETRQGYLNNIVIIKAGNALDESSKALMKSSAQILDNSLQSFAVKKEEDFLFADGESSILLTFLGKYNSQTPEVTYLQTARSCGKVSYFLTLSLAEQLEDYSRYAELLQTFECEIVKE